VNAKAVGIMGTAAAARRRWWRWWTIRASRLDSFPPPARAGRRPIAAIMARSTANLTAPNEFHWFAGNFLKYGAAGHSADEMPVDSHQFIALVAPRAVFIGGGALITDPDYAPGDAWQDAQGMFMAAAAASPAWEVQGHKGLGTSTFPAMGALLDSGEVAFRQHQYGHTPAPNWPAFIQFASKYLN
jgi:hypothetical protein